MISKPLPRILLLGGYGNLGKQLCEMLPVHLDAIFLVGGRHLEKAEALIAKIHSQNSDLPMQAVQIDWQSENFAETLVECEVSLVVNLAGPFTHQDNVVARTCIELGIHYIDVAEGREFVVQFPHLDEKAKERRVIAITGAGIVTGITSVVIHHFAKQFGLLVEVDIGVALGNKVVSGPSSVSSLLHNVGKPFQRLQNGHWKTVYGWQQNKRHYYGDNLGLRWHANADIPELILLPKRYPSLKTVLFHLGLEVTPLHFLLSMMAILRKIHLVGNWDRYFKMVQKICRWFNVWGSDQVAISISMNGSSHRYQPLEINWSCVAEKGDGANLSILPCLLLIPKILKGKIEPGAHICEELFTIEEMYGKISVWDVYHTLEEKES